MPSLTTLGLQTKTQILAELVFWKKEKGNFQDFQGADLAAELLVSY